MKIVETKIINIKDIILGQCMVRPIEEIKNNEDLQNLTDSICEKGQLQPCIVREIDNKYELIGGGRRYVAISQKKSDIEVKIVIATDLEAMELSLVDNIHRKNADIKQRDSQIYKVWKFGKKLGQYKEPKDFAIKISLSERKIKDIIYAGDTIEKKEYRESEAIKNATTTELVATKSLSNLPK